MKTLLLGLAIFVTTADCIDHVLAQDLERGNADAQRYGSRKPGGVLSDTRLPDLNAYTADGKPIKLRQLCDGKYTVLVAGCLTCPQFHRGYSEIETASNDYSPKGVQFYYFYKSLRHPELNGYVEAQNTQERLLQLAEARRQLGTNVPWIADTIDNQLRDGLSSGSNSVYLISPEGKIVFAVDRLDGASLRSSLASHVGKVEQPTRVSDLNLPRIERQRQQANIETDTQVSRPDGLVIVTTTPKSPMETFYVKLRAEAEADLLKTGTGRLFLGFYPDPIHGVHWNNLTEPMMYSLTLPDGVKSSPGEATAKKGPGDKDKQPRQFWVEIEGDSPGAKLELSMHYFGCTDSMCKPLTQDYTVELKPAEMGSSTFGFNRGPRGAGDRQQGRQRRGRRTPSK